MSEGNKSFGARLGEGAIELVLEIVITAVFFGVGALILWLFGVNIDFESADLDLIVLVGVAVFFAVFAVVAVIVKAIGKHRS